MARVLTLDMNSLLRGRNQHIYHHFEVFINDIVRLGVSLLNWMGVKGLGEFWLGM
jgi:hypothetical protein